MAISHERRLNKHFGPDGIPYASVVAHDMFTLQELLEKTVGKVLHRPHIVETVKKRKLAKYGHWKRRSEGLVMAVTEGEIEGKCLPGRRRTAWIDNVGRWTEGGLPAARRIALDRL